MAHKNLGGLLIEKGHLTEEQLQKALKEQKTSRKRLGNVLMDMSFISEAVMASALGEQMGVPFFDLDVIVIEDKILKILDERDAQRLQVIPVKQIGHSLSVAMIDPFNIQVVDELNKITGLDIQPAFGTETAIKKILEKHYKSISDLDEAVREYADQNVNQEFFKQNVSKVVNISADEASDNAPTIKLINLVISQSIKDGASDIHFEPNEDSFQIRSRIDGVLYPLIPPPHSLQNAMISRLKVLANLDIAEKRLPQDGRVQISIDSKMVDLRISTFPTIHGENVVIRILDKSQGILSLSNLGFSEMMLKNINDLITKPNGIILVTGPTGSGKTTTLYSFLREINKEDKNIMTLEDPVEYQIKGIRQAHVNAKAGLTFSLGLRSILRQDPDVIMIGEIRDLETAEISIQASLTGHLVFSTLHTNSAAATITRLIDMGIEPFLISSSLSGIIAQKLIRKLCDSCKKPYTPSPSLLNNLNLMPDEYTFYEEGGCDECRGTGFKGRIGVYEVCVPSETVVSMINERKSALDIQNTLKNEGFVDIKSDGIEKILMGVTSVSEVLRVL